MKNGVLPRSLLSVVERAWGPRGVVRLHVAADVPE